METTNPCTLPKEERLCSKKGISMLLAEGRHGNVPGIRFTFRTGTGECRPRLLVSVPKKLFKRAVKRNLLKRRLRESWRRQKHLLNCGSGMDILMTYSTKDILSYGEIYEAVSRIIGKINERTAE